MIPFPDAANSRPRFRPLLGCPHPTTAPRSTSSATAMSYPVVASRPPSPSYPAASSLSPSALSCLSLPAGLMPPCVYALSHTSCLFLRVCLDILGRCTRKSSRGFPLDIQNPRRPSTWMCSTHPRVPCANLAPPLPYPLPTSPPLACAHSLDACTSARQPSLRASAPRHRPQSLAPPAEPPLPYW